MRILAMLLLAAVGAACDLESQDGDFETDTPVVDNSELEIDGHALVIGSATTWLKKTEEQASALTLGSEKCRLYADSVVPIQTAPAVYGDHYRVNTRRVIPGCGFSLGYVFVEHVDSLRPGDAEDLLRPVPGPVSSYYGPRNGGFHSGLDIAAPTGTPIRNPADGVLRVQRYAGGCGNSFEVDHSGGLDSRYCHLSAYAGSVGRFYPRSTILGRVGNTGNSTGPHLHVELYLNGQLRDPLSIAPNWE